MERPLSQWSARRRKESVSRRSHPVLVTGRDACATGVLNSMKVSVIVVSIVALVAVFSVAGLTAGGQARGRGQAPAGPAIPRTADGKPDLSGVWQVLDNSLDGNIEPHVASYGVHGGQGAIVDPADGKIPYLPAALTKRQANYKNRAKDPTAYCFKPGVPRITYMPFPFQITQTPKMIQLTYEFVHNYRSVYINDSEHLPGIDFYNGDSRAKWDGDTLVVDVTGLNDDPDHPTWFDSTGNYHSDALHVVERWTRTGPDTMVYRATMEDPKVFSRPWTVEVW